MDNFTKFVFFSGVVGVLVFIAACQKGELLDIDGTSYTVHRYTENEYSLQARAINKITGDKVYAYGTFDLDGTPTQIEAFVVIPEEEKIYYNYVLDSIGRLKSAYSTLKDEGNGFLYTFDWLSQTSWGYTIYDQGWDGGSHSDISSPVYESKIRDSSGVIMNDIYYQKGAFDKMDWESLDENRILVNAALAVTPNDYGFEPGNIWNSMVPQASIALEESSFSVFKQLPGFFPLRPKIPEQDFSFPNYRLEVDSEWEAPQIGVIGQKLGKPIKVKVVNAAGVSKEGVPVTFVSSTTDTTILSDRYGTAEFDWLLSMDLGAQDLEVHALFDQQLTFTVSAIDSFLVDPRDGEIYPVVSAVGMVWTAENLRYDIPGTYVNPDVPSLEYGKLYTWAQVMDLPSSYNTSDWEGSDVNHQGICPVGWRVPTYAEFRMLASTHGGGYSRIDLKSTTGWGTGGNGTNLSGMDILPAGHYSVYWGGYYGLGTDAWFWTATDDPAPGTTHLPNRAEGFHIDKDDRNPTYLPPKIDGLACRCVKD